jgi:hypothetical protein
MNPLQNAPWDRLPHVLLCCALAYLERNDMAECTVVDKRWRKAAKDGLKNVSTLMISRFADVQHKFPQGFTVLCSIPGEAQTMCTLYSPYKRPEHVIAMLETKAYKLYSTIKLTLLPAHGPPRVLRVVRRWSNLCVVLVFVPLSTRGHLRSYKVVLAQLNALAGRFGATGSTPESATAVISLLNTDHSSCIQFGDYATHIGVWGLPFPVAACDVPYLMYRQWPRAFGITEASVGEEKRFR